MSEPRKNHLNIDGGQVKEDEHVGSYKPILETESEFRSSKSNLSKSKEKLSADGAEEKLLPKEEEAKIVTRVDMADAKYVVGDHRNGDAKIELDANKRQFSGLTKEELLKYADDPFWVNLRWFLFVLFWAMWVCMLAGAVVIIVRAPKCPSPEPKTWFQCGPHVDMKDAPLNEVQDALSLLKTSAVQGVFIDAPTYEVLQEPNALQQFKELFKKAKEAGVRVIVDLIPNYVSKSNPWFALSENKTGEYSDYFVWGKGSGFVDLDEPAKAVPERPNNWVSVDDSNAWNYSEIRGEYYLHMYGAEQPDLNFGNDAVVRRFGDVLRAWIKEGAAGVRLSKVRHLFVAGDYASWQQEYTLDDSRLRALLGGWADDVKQANSDGEVTLFTLEVDGLTEKLVLQSTNSTNSTAPRLAAAAAPIPVTSDAAALATRINNILGNWPLLQLEASDEIEGEVAVFAMLLPAAPVLLPAQLAPAGNSSLRRAAALRADASLQHGNYSVLALPSIDDAALKVVACARWKEGHTGYVAVLNPQSQDLRVNLTAMPSLPAELTLSDISEKAKGSYNGTTKLQADDVLVPALTTVVLDYVPQTAATS